ncbi:MULTISPECIES: phosphopantetheine-binding protein [unclassified Pseudoclavibacter]|uniref:phosphopantetheine-binding protein n=1 Tax=unclassified Pseudoclavibacter TaxID=2615177 RepID=UPI0012F1D497|nr:MULTISPECIES: phosphopantetheine-binding protein [unclassified Pseudoclavibacter]MBF4457722.1 hypothetical protein [Pseudoclavibacter sp. VKM Ac-2867]VXB60261.1 conserved hypothetical protein [Pseudoclavibacter sp. 8L]
MANTDLENDIVAAIVTRLGLEIETADVDVNAPIFAALAEGTEFEESSLNLDSIDILEVVLALGSAFDVELPDDQPEIFGSVRAIATHISEQRPLDAPSS